MHLNAQHASNQMKNLYKNWKSGGDEMGMGYPKVFIAKIIPQPTYSPFFELFSFVLITLKR
jgi:hypothetical protein